MMLHKVHRYEIGTRLLCFEPDTSKAKLIYFAKILRHVQNSKLNEPHYGVHFHGWKCKWDREVPEHLLLENTEFNRMLKRKIDEIVRHERNRHKRKDRIDLVLQNASLCGDDVDWDSIPGVWKSSVKTESQLLVSQPTCNQEEVLAAEKPYFTFDDLELNLMDTEESTQLEFENLQAHDLFYTPFPLTSSLASFMDAHAIVGPAELSAVNFGWSSLVQVLQAYLDGFPYQNLKVPNNLSKVKTYERSTRQLGPAYLKVDRSRLVCAEVCSSLRVLFDCMADDYLILPHEKSSIQKHPSWNERSLHRGRAFSIPPNQISAVQSDSNENSTFSVKFELLPYAYAIKTPDLPCLSYPAHLLLRLFDNLPDILRSMQMSSCRRSIISRHLYLFTQYLDVTRSFWFTKEIPGCVEKLLHSSEPSDVQPAGSQMNAGNLLRADRHQWFHPYFHPTKSDCPHTAGGGTPVARQSKQKDRGARSETSSSADTEPLTTTEQLKPVGQVCTVRHRARTAITEKPQTEPAQQPRFSLRSHSDQSRKGDGAQTTTATLTLQTRKRAASPLSFRSRKTLEIGMKSSSVLTSPDQEDERSAPINPPRTRTSARLSSAPVSDASVREEEEEKDGQSGVPMTRFRLLFAGVWYVGSSHLWRLSAGRPALSFAAARRQASHQPADTLPPYRRHRDSTSVLRALNSCIAPVPDAPDFRLGPDPYLGSHLDMRVSLLARAKGRLAARLAVSQYFPNDVAALAKEVPRVDLWCPVQSPDGLLDQVSQGQLSPAEAMDRLVLLMAPSQAWTLYNEVASSEAWSSEMLHRLLDLLCATNSGAGGAHPHTLWDGVDLTCPPDPDEIYFADELTIHFNKQTLSKRASGRPSRLQEEEEEEVEGERVDHLDGAEEEVEAGDSPEAGVGEVLDSSKLQTSMNATVKSTGSTAWLVHGPAEQLFHREAKTLNTPAAFCSMIRGASTFSRPERAVELAELAWNSSTEGNSCLDVPTYITLIRSLHNLQSVKTDHKSLWPLIRSIVDRLIASRQPIDVSVFSAILFCLAETVSTENKSPAANVTEEYITIGLALLDELRKMGLEPSLGVFANLLRVIHYARPSSSPMATSRQTGVSCRGLVDSFVSELAHRFSARQPTRGDSWSPDDYTFFPMAMRIAWLESDLTLGQRIDHLLTRGPDLRWLLATSLLRRAYVLAYCSLMLDASTVFYQQQLGISGKTAVESAESRLEKLRNIDQLYRAHWGSIATTNKLSTLLVNCLVGHLRAATSLEGDNNQRVAASLAYTCFDDFFNHLTQRSRAMDFNRKVGLRVAELSHLLREFAHCSPHRAVKTSASMLTKLKVATERLVSLNSRKPEYRQPLLKLPPDLVTNFVEMTFPSLELGAVTSGGSDEDMAGGDSAAHWTQRAFSTLHDWLVFTVDQQAMSWNWAPKVINTIFTNTDEADTEKLIWDGLRQLSRMPYRPRSGSELSMCRAALEPVLSELETRLPALVSVTSGFVTSQLNAVERRELLSSLRRTLEEAATRAPGREEEQLDVRESGFGDKAEAEMEVHTDRGRGGRRRRSNVRLSSG